MTEDQHELIHYSTKAEKTSLPLAPVITYHSSYY
jgi:hypothetical protein